MTINSPLVLVGSVTADINVEVEGLLGVFRVFSREGSNQVPSAAHLSNPTYFCGHVHDFRH